jgi:hypothetical protein
MLIKKSLVLIFAILFFSLMLVAAASAVSISVDAQTATIANPQDTGIDVTAGQVLTINSDPNDTWSLGSNSPYTRTSNADGLVNSPYGQYTSDGLTANFGAMVGRIDDGTYFVVGTNSGPITLTSSGRLYLVDWDSIYSDNSGSITANINLVPIPASILLLGTSFIGIALLGWRRRKAV